MIVNLILDLILSMISGIAHVLPTGGLPTAVATSFNTIIGYMYVVNGFFPIDTLITLAILSITIQIFVLTWNLGHMILKYIRGN